MVLDLLTNAVFIALVGTIFGGVGLKVVEHFLARSKVRRANYKEDVRDYREEIRELVNRMDVLEEENLYWRRRFYEEQEYTSRLRRVLIEMGHEPPQQVAFSPSTPIPRVPTEEPDATEALPVSNG